MGVGMEHLRKLAMLVLILSVLLSSLAGLVTAQEKIKFPVGVGTKTIGTNMFWLATKKGFFDEFGLDVQPILLRGSAITMQALVSESLYLALGSADATIGAAASGADLLAVGGVVNGLTQTIVAAKQYKTIKDLRGATIGVQVLTSVQPTCSSASSSKTAWSIRPITSCLLWAAAVSI